MTLNSSQIFDAESEECAPLSEEERNDAFAAGVRAWYDQAAYTVVKGILVNSGANIIGSHIIYRRKAS